MNRLQSLLCVAVAALAAGAPNPALAQAKPKVDPQLQAKYRQMAGAIDPNRLYETIKTLSSVDSRVAGYPGSAAAERYVEQQFRAIGLENIEVENFEVTVPVDDATGSLEVAGQRVQIRGLWPNLVRTSKLPKDGLKAPLLWAGASRLVDYNGRDVNGSAVIVDFNSGSDWLNAARLGARAIIFVEPSDTMRGEAEAKFLSIPVDIPRFWISMRDAARIIPLTQVQTPPAATLRCDMNWERRSTKNIVGEIRGTDPKMRDQWMVLEAYYDAMSVVPSIAPGADQACSIAGLLELARAFKANPPGRSIRFIATGGHFLGLQGIKHYLGAPGPDGQARVDKLAAPGLGEKIGAFFTRRKLRQPETIYLMAGLDLSSHSRGVGIFYKGMFYDFREDIQNKFSDIARVFRENSERVSTTFGLDPGQAFADGVNPISGKSWRSFLQGKFAFDAEVWTLAGARGVTLATVEDRRDLQDTPFDTINTVNIDNLSQQVKMLACLFWHAFTDTNELGEQNKIRMPITEASTFTRMGLQGGLATLRGRVVQFDLTKSFIPSVPVPGALAVIANNNKSYSGVRGPSVQMVADPSPQEMAAARSGKRRTADDIRKGEGGSFEFLGVPPLTAFGGNVTTHVEAYHLNPDTGEIDYAPDLGMTGAKAYPIDVTMTMGVKEVQVIVFPCKSTSVYDLVDPLSLRALRAVNVYDGETNAEPRMYGIAVGKTENLQSHIEDMAVFFAQPGYTIKVVMGAGPAATRLILINSKGTESAEEAEGIGYQLGQPVEGNKSGRALQAAAAGAPQGQVAEQSYERTIPFTGLLAARDMWRLDEFRIEKLAKYRIINQGINDLHKSAKERLDLAEAALGSKDYSLLNQHARAAWGFEARAYPDVQQTARDVVQGVLFYMALLLPFAFFMERLLFGFPKLQHQLVGFFGIFIAVFIVMRYIHPAFDITMNPMIVLLAFIILALSVLVTVLIAGKFEQQLKEYNKSVSGVHRADVGRMSVAAAAFSMGISNMRRRKARTFLTCMTLVLLTFIVLSFTSVVQGMRFNIVKSPGTPLYNGVMLRSANWDALEETTYRLLNDEFGREHAVAPRAWYYGTQMGEQTFLALQRGDKTFNARGILGMTPQETRVLPVDKSLLVGRWFQPGDTYAILLPREIAEALSVTPDAVQTGSATVRYAGVPYTVIGIFDNQSFKQVTDLDNEFLTPVDFILMQKMSQQSGGGGGGGGSEAFKDYQHLEPNTVAIIPYETLINQGGQVRSVAIDFLRPDEVTRVRKDLMPRLALNLYAGDVPNKVTYRYSAMGSASIAGVGTLAVPIGIAALIVLQTMLSAVAERRREIAIFSAIGLAPKHVAMLFIAESMVYAVIGAIAGYVVGQGTAKIIVATDILQGLNLNFSSMSAVFSTLLVMAVVLLSTLYPARQASEVATPSIERSWRLPEPQGDDWVIPLPFAVTGEQARGLNGFLSEWFRAYEEYSIGDFVTQNVRTSDRETELGRAYQIRTMAWLAPFDLGVSQEVVLDTLPTDMKDVYELRLTIHRQSGDISNWKRVNRRFMNTLRKQFLIWRTLAGEERERYFRTEAHAETATAAPATA